MTALSQLHASLAGRYLIEREIGRGGMATVYLGRVAGVLLVGRTFATDDSIGVGTPLRRLLGFPQVKGYGVAGRLIVTTPAKCGLRFDIAGRFNDLPDGVMGGAALGRLPLAAVVDRNAHRRLRAQR